jgi:hypothetical protein
MRALNVLIALGALLGLLALVLAKRRPARSPAWMLLRSLFPSWRFFESIAPAPILSYRVARGQQGFGAWQAALLPVPRTPLSLVLNARGNLHLANRSLVERFFDDLDSMAPEQAAQSVSYQLVQRLVRSELGAVAPSEDRLYQFKLTLPDDSDGDVFVSEVHAR